MPRKPASTIPADANDPEVPADFGMRVVHWQRAHGRHDLPWQNTRDPYRIWLSEIMLQQTQVSAVIDYYQRFMASLPTVEALAAAPADEVMALWAGLGYYSRARNLHACARQVVAEHQGRFPTDPAVLVTLPGIGRSTAAAIAAFSAGVRTPFSMATSSVCSRASSGARAPGERAVEACMWRLADAALPPAGAEQARDMVSYTQGLMDLGATICSRGRPACLADVSACPLADGCVARRDGLTGVLPSPKPRAAQPERSTVMVMLRRGREILLTLRPAAASGAACGPARTAGGTGPFDAEQAEDAALAYAHGHGTPSRAVFSGELTHVFTHFRLLIRAVRVDMAAPAVRDGDGPAEAAAPAWRWVALDQLDGVGVPAPVRKLLLAQAAPGLF